MTRTFLALLACLTLTSVTLAAGFEDELRGMVQGTPKYCQDYSLAFSTNRVAASQLKQGVCFTSNMTPTAIKNKLGLAANITQGAPIGNGMGEGGYLFLGQHRNYPGKTVVLFVSTTPTLAQPTAKPVSVEAQRQADEILDVALARKVDCRAYAAISAEDYNYLVSNGLPRVCGLYIGTMLRVKDRLKLVYLDDFYIPWTSGSDGSYARIHLSNGLKYNIWLDSEKTTIVVQGAP